MTTREHSSSIRRDLIIRVAGGVVLVMLMAGAATYLLARSALRGQAIEALVARAESFALLVIDEQPDPDDQDPGGLVLDYKGPLTEADVGVLLRVRTADRGVLKQSPEWASELALPPIPEIDEPEHTSSNVVFEDGRRALMVTLVTYAQAEIAAKPDESPAEIEPDDVDSEPEEDDEDLERSEHVIVVEVIGSAEGLHDAQAAVLTAILVGTVGAGIGAWLIVRLTVGRSLAPLRSLVDDLGRLNALDPRTMPLDAHEPTELRPIRAAINGLLSRVRAALDRERRFTDAAAHELRTPLAELRSITDVAQAYPDAERLERCARESGTIAVEMTWLMEALLTVARRDPAIHDETDSTRLAPHVESTVGRHRDALSQRGITCRCDLDSAAAWDAPPGAVLMIVRNLIDNAAQYTPAGGEITIALRDAADGVILEVRNGPVGLSADDLGDMFEPFWRADSARTDRSHQGLGLAIVAAQCEALGCQPEAVLIDDRTLAISVHPRPRACAPGPATSLD